MITGDNPLTIVHVARDVEIVDRDALILDLREDPGHEGGMKTPMLSSFGLYSPLVLHRSCVEDRRRDQDHLGQARRAS